MLGRSQERSSETKPNMLINRPNVKSTHKNNNTARLGKGLRKFGWLFCDVGKKKGWVEKKRQGKRSMDGQDRSCWPGSRRQRLGSKLLGEGIGTELAMEEWLNGCWLEGCDPSSFASFRLAGGSRAVAGWRESTSQNGEKVAAAAEPSQRGPAAVG
jgi:hypothetical protein